MKKWINDIINEGGEVTLKNGLCVSPESYIGNGYYLGDCDGEDIVFHESEVTSL